MGSACTLRLPASTLCPHHSQVAAGTAALHHAASRLQRLRQIGGGGEGAGRLTHLPAGRPHKRHLQTASHLSYLASTPAHLQRVQPVGVTSPDAESPEC